MTLYGWIVGPFLAIGVAYFFVLALSEAITTHRYFKQRDRHKRQADKP